MTHHREEDSIEFEVSFSNKEEAEIRTRLIALQAKIREANIPVIILLCGVNGSGDAFGPMGNYEIMTFARLRTPRRAKRSYRIPPLLVRYADERKNRHFCQLVVFRSDGIPRLRQN